MSLSAANVFAYIAHRIDAELALYSHYTWMIIEAFSRFELFDAHVMDKAYRALNAKLDDGRWRPNLNSGEWFVLN